MYRRAGRQPDADRDRHRGHAARRADRGAARPRRRAAGPDPPHVLRPALGVHPAVPAQGLGPDATTGSRTTRPRSPTGRSSPGRSGRRRTGSGPRSTAAASRPTPSRCARSPAPTRCSPTRRRCPRATRAPRSPPALTLVRDAMLANPEMVGGTRDRLDTSLMKALPGRVVSKGGMEALRGLAILPGDARRSGAQSGRDRDGGEDRGRRRLRARHVGGVGRGARPGRRRSTARRFGCSPATTGRRSSIRTAGSARRRSPSFELAPLGELVGA